MLTVVGTHTLACGGASDRAGNAGSSSATLQSIYRYDGFLQPINDTAHQVGLSASIFKAGSTKGLASGFYYGIGVRLDDGQTYYVNIGLR